MRYRCKDCGAPDYTPSNGLASICEPCWVLRTKITDAMFGNPDFDYAKFADVQREMTSGRYHAADAMRRFLETLPTKP